MGHRSDPSDPARQYLAAIDAKSPLASWRKTVLRYGRLSLFNVAGGFCPTRAAILAEPRVKRFDALEKRIESAALRAIRSLEIGNGRARLIVNVLRNGLLHDQLSGLEIIRAHQNSGRMGE